MSIAIFFAVDPVVTLVVGDLVIQRKAIVRANIIDALKGVAGVHQGVGKEIVAAVESSHQSGNQPGISADGSSHIVSKIAVPLSPPFAGKSGSQLMQAGCVPW